ncbi:hypothetical protein ONS95_004210 [Cadophora gregata]|uniref:uncharacterized protein n=1 Tax=Cadophora gregata TaxID=51156 RepID=UPI0026DD6493|nr:uncharacterized protein ONS95_004210 [Cadophora gregata]KAK0105418.1 hypothetical protein ONS96_004808 [Cadophora gregata f. sp. sojae]KAK0105683.1 hypothetical protein ONS95_004210 [Cadophora gregata]
MLGIMNKEPNQCNNGATTTIQSPTPRRSELLISDDNSILSGNEVQVLAKSCDLEGGELGWFKLEQARPVVEPGRPAFAIRQERERRAELVIRADASAISRAGSSPSYVSA